MMRPLPTWAGTKHFGRIAARVFIVLALATALYGLAWGIENAHAARDLAQTSVNLSRQNLRSQDNHHANTVKKDAQLQVAIDEVKQSAAAIKYLLGVVTYEGAEIINAQQSGHATLMAIAALQMEVSQDLPQATTALKAGQAQINTYLHYLTCLGTNPTNAAVCGAAPPLPPTS